MSYTRTVTRGNGEIVVEVFVKGEELMKVLKQQGVASDTILSDREYCLTFSQCEEEKYG